MRTRSARTGLVGVLALLSILLLPLAAVGHSGTESYVYLEVFDDGLEGRVEFPVEDLNQILGLEIPQEEEAARDAIERHLEQIQAYAAENLAMGLDGQDWIIEYAGFSVIPAAGGTYAVVDFVVTEDFDAVPRQFTVTYTGVIESLPTKSALLLVATDWQSGTLNNDSESLLRYSSGNTTQVVDLGETSWIQGFTAVVGLGVEHIQIGFDHILFIIALVLPAVLVYSMTTGWVPTASFGSSFWRVVKIATSFTIAHTITLALGGLGIVEISSALVESLIAVSIALAALHNLGPVAVNREWIIAFLFGLVHGFGFASLLTDLGLDRSNRIVSLLGFNLGIEIGQVVIILLVFPALFLARRTRYYLGFMRLGSIALIAISAGWLFDRAFGIDVGVDDLMTRVMLMPRPLILIVVMTLTASFLYWWEKRAGRLIPVGTDAPDKAEPVHARADL